MQPDKEAGLFESLGISPRSPAPNSPSLKRAATAVRAAAALGGFVPDSPIPPSPVYSHTALHGVALSVSEEDAERLVTLEKVRLPGVAAVPVVSDWIAGFCPSS